MPCCNSTTGSVQPSLRPDEAEEALRRRFASAHRHRRHPQQRRRTRKREDVYRFRRRSYLRSPEKGSLRSHYSKCLLREVLEPPVDSAAFFLIGPPLVLSAGKLSWPSQLGLSAAWCSRNYGVAAFPRYWPNRTPSWTAAPHHGSRSYASCVIDAYGICV